MHVACEGPAYPLGGASAGAAAAWGDLHVVGAYPFDLDWVTPQRAAAAHPHHQEAARPLSVDQVGRGKALARRPVRLAAARSSRLGVDALPGQRGAHDSGKALAIPRAARQRAQLAQQLHLERGIAACEGASECEGKGVDGQAGLRVLDRGLLCRGGAGRVVPVAPVSMPGLCVP